MTSPPPIDALSDRELVARYVRRRDEPAFAALVRRHSRLVLGVCHRVLGHRQDVEDAFQATFLVLARDAHRVKKRDSLASWLHGVAYRTSLRAAESRHRRIRLLQDVTMIEDSSLADVAARHERQLLDEELQSLPDKYRAPLVLHYLESKTAKQVAGELKLSVSTVEGRLKRGRKELQLRLARRGIGLSVALAALPLTPSVVTAAEVETLVGHTIHAGLSYTAGDPAGPLYTHEAARLAAQETLAMTTATTTATLTALLLVPVALAISNHGDGVPTRGHASQIVTGVEQALGEPITIASTEIAQATDTADIQADIRETRSLSDVERRIVESARRILESAERRVLESLGKQVTLHFDDAPLSEVIMQIAKTAGINVVVDEVGLRHENVTVETPVTINVEGIRLRSALPLILKPLNLGYTVEDEVLKITSKSQLEVQRDEPSARIVEPVDFGGMRGIQIREGDHNLTIWDFNQQSANAARIAETLKQQTNVEFVDTPLSEAIQYISKVHGITILFDEPELVDIGLATDEPVNLIIEGVKLESALNLMLRPLGLDYAVRDEVMMITSTEVTKDMRETRVYELRQLPKQLAYKINDLIDKSVEGPWNAEGGGTITLFDGGMIVRHNPRVHRDVAELLKQLERHAAQGKQ